MMNKKFRVSRKLKKLIPEGMYCYVFTGKTSLRIHSQTGDVVTAYHTKVCPKYFTNKFGYGDCRLLSPPFNGETDDDFDFCLDDQCKGCGINYKWGRSRRKRSSNKPLAFRKKLKKKARNR